MLDYTLKFNLSPNIYKNRLNVYGLDRHAKIYTKFLGFIAYLFNFAIKARYTSPLTGKPKVWYINANSFAKGCQNPSLFNCSTKLKTFLGKAKRPVFATAKPRPRVESKPPVKSTPASPVASSLNSKFKPSAAKHKAVLEKLLFERSPNDLAWQKAQLACFDQICLKMGSDQTLSVSDFEKGMRLEMENKKNPGYTMSYAWIMHEYAQKVFS